MFRIETTLFIVSSLPFVIALIFNLAVVPRRKNNFQTSMQRSARPATTTANTSATQKDDTEQAIQSGVSRAIGTYQSLASYRLLIPAGILSVLYWIGLSLGLSFIVDRTISGWIFSGYISRPFVGFNKLLLAAPASAVLGAYLFNTGVLIRRAYVADITKNVMWASINRLIFSVGLSVLFHLTSPQFAAVILSFSIAFFPGLIITWLRKQTTATLGLNDDTCNELNVQLIQGIDIWKEERLEEEGIESIQNMATADIFELIPKLHFPVRTIVDWMDQAIFIQRFATCYQDDKGVPSRLRLLEGAGFRISAISAAIMGRNADTQDGAALVQHMATTLSTATNTISPLVLRASLNQLKDDAQILVLDRLWQSGAAED